MSDRVPVLGLTGGIGSGKSAVADMLAMYGAAIVDTDVIARELCAVGGAALPAIRAHFGEQVMAADGSLDRAAMRKRVFADAAARQQLESILHPLIRAQADAQLAAATAAYAVLVVPLMVESGHWIARCDRIAVVDCPEDVQVQRVVARSSLSEADVRAIMTAQATRAQRRAIAHEIIDNAADFDSLRAQVVALHSRMLQIGRGKS